MALAAGTLNVSGLLALGSGPQFDDGGTLRLADASHVAAATLDVVSASVVSLDATSSVSVGTTQSVAGAVLVGAGATLDGAGGTIEGNVVDDGTLLAVSQLPGTLALGPTITGTLGGDGVVPIEYQLVVGNAAGFSGAFNLDPGAELTIGSGGIPLASIAMLNATVDLQSVGVAAPVYDAATGQLSVDGSVLNVGTGLSQYDFTTTSDGTGGVLVVDHPYRQLGRRRHHRGRQLEQRGALADRRGAARRHHRRDRRQPVREQLHRHGQRAGRRGRGPRAR